MTQNLPQAQREASYQVMVESVRDYAIFMLDANGMVQTWNQGAERIKGYAPAEIIGQHMSRFYPPEDRKAGRPERLLRKAVEEGRVEDEGWRLRKDGSRFWADVVITALRNEDGSLRGFVKVTRDLSERRIAEERLRLSEERFRLMVESVKDYAIFMLDPDGKVATWNAGAERIHGFSPAEILGKHLSTFYEPEGVAAGYPKRELEVATRDGRFEDEGWRLRKDGSRFWASVVLTALYDPRGELLGFAKVTRDLTLRREAEDERIRLAQAEEAIRLRDDFLAVASHELKTPLTSLQLQIDTLSAGDERLGPKSKLRIERATRSVKRLVALVEALLDVSRISTGQLRLSFERIDLGQLAGEVVERLGYAAESAEAKVSLRVQPGVVGSWDRLRIDQVLSNLLTNAFKYAAGTEVRVDVRAAGDRAVVVVADRGPGVSEEAKQRVFERFERATSKRHYGGLGLGLYVAREIVEQHGGQIAVDDNPGGGARFTVTLPLASSPDAQAEHP